MIATLQQLTTIEKITGQFINDEKTGNIKIIETKIFTHYSTKNVYFKVSYNGFDSSSGQAGTQVEWYCIKEDGDEMDCKGHFGGQEETTKYFSEMKEIIL